MKHFVCLSTASDDDEAEAADDDAEAVHMYTRKSLPNLSAKSRDGDDLK